MDCLLSLTQNFYTVQKLSWKVWVLTTELYDLTHQAFGLQEPTLESNYRFATCSFQDCVIIAHFFKEVDILELRAKLV